MGGAAVNGAPAWPGSINVNGGGEKHGGGGGGRKLKEASENKEEPSVIMPVVGGISGTGVVNLRRVIGTRYCWP